MTRVVLLAALMLLGAQPGLAQSVWGRNGVRVGISAGLQPQSGGLDETLNMLEYLEPSPLSVDVPKTDLPFADVFVAVRLAGNLGLTLGATGLIREADARVTADIPHPFYFNRPRTIEGRALDAQRAEAGLHGGAAYVVPLARRADLMLLGGATYFRLRQDVVSDVNYTEAFPFDTATFLSAQLVQVTASQWGFHAGADLTWKFGPRWGLGGLVRFTRAKVPIRINRETVATVEAGGLQVGGGIRWLL